MSKIVSVINAMISNPGNISQARVGGHEFFFCYKEKYRWSISHQKVNDSYSLYFYPGNRDIDDLINICTGPEWESLEMVNYSTTEIGTVEAFQSFYELYNVVQEKVFGIDSAFDDILSDMDI
jgi:hypothetical protein